MITLPDLPLRRTVFDILEHEAPAYQVVLDQLCEIAMAIANHFGVKPGEERNIDDLLGKLEAFERANNALLTAIRVSHTLDGLHARRQSETRPTQLRPTKLRPSQIRRTRPRRLSRSRDPEDAVLDRPISTVIGEICIDLATAAAIVGMPPWLPTTTDELRTIIVSLARREAERLEAAGKTPPTPFSAQILEYKPRPD